MGAISQPANQSGPGHERRLRDPQARPLALQNFAVKADISVGRFVPKPVMSRCSNSVPWWSIIRSPVGARAPGRRARSRPIACAALEIDHQLEMGRLLDRDVGGLGAAQYLGDHPAHTRGRSG